MSSFFSSSPPSNQRALGHLLWPLVGLLWIMWAVRAYHIMSLPIFVDESLHILRAQMVFEFGDPTASFLPGKLLLYYVLGIFNPQDVGGAWVSRQVVALLSLPGAALTYRLAQTIFKQRAVGIWAVILYALSPFLIFFERMALADTLMMVLGLALSIICIRFARYFTTRQAFLAGGLLGATVLAKLTALPWMMLPPLASLLFSRQRWWRKRMQFIRLYGVTVLLLIFPIGYVVYQSIAPVGERQEVVTTTLFVPEEHSRFQQIGHNAEIYAEAVNKMFTLPLLAIIFFASIWLLVHSWRKAIYLLSITGLVWGFILVTSARPSTRYLVVGVPPLLIITAAGIVKFRQYLNMITQQYLMGWAPLFSSLIIITLLSPWAVQGIQFSWHAWHAPQQLSLAERDIWEYYQNAAAGYGLREAADDLPSLEPLRSDGTIPVGGFVAACHTLRLYLPVEDRVEIDCPYFKWRQEFSEQTIAEWTNLIQEEGEWYILADDEQPLDLARLPVIWDELATYQRPHDGIITRLYLVTALTSREDE